MRESKIERLLEVLDHVEQHLADLRQINQRVGDALLRLEARERQEAGYFPNEASEAQSRPRGTEMSG